TPAASRPPSGWTAPAIEKSTCWTSGWKSSARATIVLCRSASGAPIRLARNRRVRCLQGTSLRARPVRILTRYHSPRPETMDRRSFIRYGASGALTASISANALQRVASAGGARIGPAPRPRPAFELEEMTISELMEHMGSGRYTARRLAELYLERIESLDRQGPALHHMLEINSDALATADRLDEERRAGRVRGPLHGIPIIVKDNIDTADMMTTAGSLALVGAPPARDAFIMERLRAAGALILGKANLSEWANFRSSKSSSGWSALGGQGRNPYVLDRTPCGSSSGTGGGVCACYAAAGIGTETNGSIVCPSNANALVGIKPTLGLLSRSGVIPIAHSQDTPGPMARTVADAAILLGAMTGEDPRDSATVAAAGHALADYTPFLDPRGLEGARIGVARKHFFGYSPEADRLAEDAIEAMKQAGAEIIDPADIPHVGEYDDTQYTVLLYEFKADLNAYLAERQPESGVRTLRDLIEFNIENRDREMPYFGQEIFELAEAKGPLTETEYLDALAKNHRLSREEGIDAAMDEHGLDVIVAPTGSPP